MINRNFAPALGVLAALAVASSAFGQTTVNIASVNFASNPGNLDNDGLPSTGTNTVVTAPAGAAYALGTNVTIHTASVTAVASGSYQNEPSFRLENDGFPGMNTYFALSSVVGTYTSFTIASDVVMALGDGGPYSWNPVATLLANSAIAAASTWTIEAYESYDDDVTGNDSTGTGIAFTINMFVPTEQGNWETFEPLVTDAAYSGTAGSFTADRAWTYQNNSAPIGVTSWFTGNDAVFTAQNGAHYLGANFNSTAGVGTIDNWLISEEKTLNNGDVVSFWTRSPEGSTFPDRLHLKLSSNGASTNVGDFTTVLVSVNPSLTVGDYPGTWTKYSGTVSGLSGATSCRLAFHYDVTDAGPSGSNSDYIGIDDISITAPGQTLSGNLILGDTAFSGASTRNIAWSVMQGTTNLGSGTIVAGAPSTAMNLAVGAGTGAATLVLDGSSFLKRAVSIALTGSNQAIGNATMQNGDVDGTGEVDAADIDQVIAAFGNMGDNVEDVDVSDEVDAADIDIVIANFGGMDD